MGGILGVGKTYVERHNDGWRVSVPVAEKLRPYILPEKYRRKSALPGRQLKDCANSADAQRKGDAGSGPEHVLSPVRQARSGPSHPCPGPRPPGPSNPAQSQPLLQPRRCLDAVQTSSHASIPTQSTSHNFSAQALVAWRATCVTY
jgi:hypothetical protein